MTAIFFWIVTFKDINTFNYKYILDIIEIQWYIKHIIIIQVVDIRKLIIINMIRNNNNKFNDSLLYLLKNYVIC